MVAGKDIVDFKVKDIEPVLYLGTAKKRVWHDQDNERV